MSKSTKNSKANPGSSANANASAKPAVSQVIGDTKPSKSVKTAGTNGTTKANPIPPPQLDHVEGLSSPNCRLHLPNHQRVKNHLWNTESQSKGPVKNQL